MSKRDINSTLLCFETYGFSNNNNFVGREQQINDIILKLEKENFISCIGPAESGKTSLINAGLIPTLQNSTHNKWCFYSCNKDINSLNELLKSLDRLTKNDTNQEVVSIIQKFLVPKYKDSLTFIKNKNAKHLIIIDDFYCSFIKNKKHSPEKLNEFVSAINSIIRSKNSRIYLLTTFQDSHISKIIQYNEFIKCINNSLYLVPPLNKEQTCVFIKTCFNELNVSISDKLIKVIDHDITHHKYPLPVLQYTLYFLYKSWIKQGDKNAPIQLVDYKNIGRSTSAINTNAEHAFNVYTDEEKKACCKLFKSLIKIEEKEYALKKLSFTEIRGITGSSETILKKIISELSSSKYKLLDRTDNEEVLEHDVISLSSLSITVEWKRLELWIHEEIESSETYIKLCKAASLYQNGDRDLMKNPDLEVVLSWFNKERPTEDWGKKYDRSYKRAINFLQESHKVYKQRKKFKEVSQARRIKKNKQIITLTSIGFFICLFLGIYSWIERQSAIKFSQELIVSNKKAKEKAIEANEAKEKTLISIEKEKKASELAKASQKKALKNAQIANSEKQKALILKEKAEANAEKAQLAEKKAKESAIREKAYAVSESKAKEVSLLNEQEAQRLKNMTTAINLAFEAEKKLDQGEKGLGIDLALKAYNIYKDNDSTKTLNNQIFQAINRAYLEVVEDKKVSYKHDMGIKNVKITNSINPLVALVDYEDKLTLLSSKNGIFKKEIKSEIKNVSDVSFSNSKDELIISTYNGYLRFFNIQNSKFTREVNTHNNQINSIEYTKVESNPHLLLKHNSGIQLYNLAINKLSSNKKLDYEQITINKTGNKILSIEGDILKLYQLSISKNTIQLNLKYQRKINKGVSKIKILEDNLFAACYSNGLVEIYALVENQLNLKESILNHKKVRISNIELCNINNKKMLITSSFDNTINLTNLNNIKETITLIGHNSWVTDFSLNKVTNQLYSISQDASVKNWLIEEKDIITELKYFKGYE